MTKHIADKDHAQPGTARVRQYTRIERETVLQTRPETRDGASRVKAYLEIERGRRV